MADVISLVICENIQPIYTPNPNGGFDIHPNIVSPLTVIQPIAVPGNYSFSIFGTIRDNGINQDTLNKMCLKIIAPNGNMVFSTGSLNITSEAAVNNDFSFSIDLRNFVFLLEGEYSIDISYNEKAIYNLHFKVLRKGASL